MPFVVGLGVNPNDKLILVNKKERKVLFVDGFNKIKFEREVLDGHLIFSQRELRKDYTEMENGSCNFKQEPNDLLFSENYSKKTREFNSLLHALKTVQKDGLNQNNSQKSKKLNKENNFLDSQSEAYRGKPIQTEIDDKLLHSPKAESVKESSLNTKIKLEVKTAISCDHTQKRIEEIVTGGNKSNDTMKVNKISSRETNACSRSVVNQLKDVETRLDKIPKDILLKLGIVIEDSDDSWRGSSELKILMDIRETEEDVNVEDEDNDGKLIIDEANLPNEKAKRIVEPKERNFSSYLDTSSLKRNFSSLPGKDQHLIISSVMSLRRKAYCNLCHEILPDSFSLVTHKRRHCTFHGCLDIIENESEREKHLQVHKAHPTKPFRCEFCKRRFSYYRYSKKHRDNCRHSKRSKCPHCKVSFSKINLFNKHIAKHMSKMTCTDCSKTYIQVKKYSKHLYAHHNKQIVFQCTECPQRFHMEHNIIRHIEVHNLRITASGLAPFIRVETA